MTELDEPFRRRRKYAGSAPEYVLAAAKRVLTVPEFDTDAITNLAIMDTVEERVTKV